VKSNLKGLRVMVAEACGADSGKTTLHMNSSGNTASSFELIDKGDNNEK
jgi:hypothetical protein